MRRVDHHLIYKYILFYLLFFFNDTATTEIYTLSLHDALPIYLLSELDSYAWEEKARDKGQDVPIKKYDHACDALRYALYTHLDGSFGTDVSMTIDDLNKLKTRWGVL